jgi:hypothetical protein
MSPLLVLEGGLLLLLLLLWVMLPRVLLLLLWRLWLLLGLKGCEVLFCLQQVLLGPDTLLAAREPPGLCYLLAQAPALLPPLQLQLQLKLLRCPYGLILQGLPLC